MKFPLLLFPLALGLALGLAPVSALAQWRTVSYALKPGWSSIYLSGDASWQSPDQHFATQEDIEEVWRWNPNPQQAQFSTTPSEPSPAAPEWSVWRRGQPGVSDLSLLQGQSAYLIRLRDGAAAQTLALAQRVEPPRVQWLRTGGNLLGFPTAGTGAGFPLFSSYFGLFPAAVAAKIYRYNGGPLNAGNPVRVLAMATERVDSTQAYWFESKTVSDFAGPLHFEVSDPTGLNFRNSGTLITVNVRNRTAATQTLTFSTESSEAPPAGQPAISGPVALTRRVFNETTRQYDHTPVSAPFTLTLLPNASAPVTFGVDRAATGGPPGALFAGIMRITDAAGMMDVQLPVTAGSSGLAGLWVGDAELTEVESKVPGAGGTTTAHPFPLRYLIHVNEGGAAVILSQVFIGELNAGGGEPGITTDETLLSPASKAKARRLTSAHLPLDRGIATSGGFGPGGTVSGALQLPFNDPVNPFVHQYHPDHNNLNDRGQPLPAGVESYNVGRAVTITFPATAPAGAPTAWGGSLLTGSYAETFTGIHRQPINAIGTITLRRVSENPVLTTP